MAAGHDPEHAGAVEAVLSAEPPLEGVVSEVEADFSVEEADFSAVAGEEFFRA